MNTGDEAYKRVARELGGTDVAARLAGLSGSDFASLMLEVARRRAARETPASVLRRYRNDRFARPGGTPWRTLRQAEDLLLGCLPADVEMVTVAPLVPLGMQAHFSLFAMVTAGRDEGSLRFEEAALREHLRFAVAGLRAAGLAAQVALTPLSDAGERIAAAAGADVRDVADEIVTDRERTAGRGYYRDVCFKVNAVGHGQPREIGDGGFTDWTARLLASKKERLLISGHGLARLLDSRSGAG